MKLIPARLSVVKPSIKRNFDIYAMNKTQPVLILSKNTPLKKGSLLFKHYANRIIYIPSEQLQAYKQLITNSLDDILKDESMPEQHKMYAIYVTFTNQLEMLMNNKNISIAKNISKNMTKFVGSILNSSSSISIFLSFIENNIHNIATHMFNVGIYSTMLTKILYPDISSTQLEKVATGYFMHDIGMIKIDKNILQKKDKYTKKEYEEIKKHPVLGAEILEKELKIKDPNIIKIILEHHERKDGSGYPYGKKDINRFARICSMCDIFDAITSKREYKDNPPETTFEALKNNKEFFVDEFGKEFYEAFVLCFKQ